MKEVHGPGERLTMEHALGQMVVRHLRFSQSGQMKEPSYDVNELYLATLGELQIIRISSRLICCQCEEWKLGSQQQSTQPYPRTVSIIQPIVCIFHRQVFSESTLPQHFNFHFRFQFMQRYQDRPSSYSQEILYQHCNKNKLINIQRLVIYIYVQFW